MNKKQLIKKIAEDFGYTQKELKAWRWIEVEKQLDTQNNVFFDGNYVIFAEDKVIWY